MSRSQRFAHGVASGDPAGEAVVLWTRVTPDGSAPMLVHWEIAIDEEFHQVVDGGSVWTDGTCDHTVRVDAHGVRPGVEHYYRFCVEEECSRVGRTRIWAEEAAILRFAATCCANFQGGYFNAYRSLAERDDLDFVLHLGDYTYEWGDWDGGFAPWSLVEGRVPDPPTETFTLEDYRARHSQFKMDPDLQDLHARHPMIHLWDDHDVCDDAWTTGCPNEDSMPVAWTERRASAMRSFWEWLPVRWPESGTDEAFALDSAPDHPRIYRQFSFGNLADLFAIDTRHEGRDPMCAGLTEETHADPDRRIMTKQQSSWLTDGLRRSEARWKLIANPSMMTRLALHSIPPEIRARVRKIGSPLGGGLTGNTGQWEGYAAARHELFEALRREGLRDLVVVTGDLHTSWAAGLVEGASDEPLGVEFVTPSVTTFNIGDRLIDRPDDITRLTRLITDQHPWVAYVDLERHGYLVVEVDADRVTGSWTHLDTTRVPDFDEWVAASWYVDRGEPLLHPRAIHGGIR